MTRNEINLYEDIINEEINDYILNINTRGTFISKIIELMKEAEEKGYKRGRNDR